MAANSGQFTSVTASRALGYAVGNTEFLDSEQSKVAKYWRSIEFGTHGFIGTPLLMLRGPKTNKWGKMTDLRDARGPLGRGLGALDEGGEDEEFGGDGSARKLLKMVIVEHEIEPHEAYKKGAAQFDPVAREKEAIEQAFINSGLDVTRDLRGRGNAIGDTGRRVTARLKGGGFLSAQSLSTRARSAVQVDRQFQSELIALNRMLAEALASEVALALQESYVRPEQSTGWLEEATLSPKNRFPL